MRSDRYQEVSILAGEVRELLLQLEPQDLTLKPNSYEPTVAESLAVALLELDRVASEPGTGFAPLPAFASTFLNRRLSKRLLERYNTVDLASEFDRRLTDALHQLGSNRDADGNAPILDRVHRLLSDLESSVLQRQSPGDRNPER